MSMESPFLLVCLVASLASLSRVLAQPVCVQPDAPLPSDTSPSDSGHVLVTTDADAARNTALCHVACINLLYANGNSDTNGTGNDTDGTIDTDGTGNDTDGIVGFFQLDCDKFETYLDCRYGCVLGSQGQSNCASTCSGRCRGELMCDSNNCFSSQVENNDCGVSCKADDCDQGCQQFMLFTDLDPPMNPPELIHMGIATQNIYTVVISDDLELIMFSNPSLVFRIEAQSQPGDYVYQWMVDVEFDRPTVNLMEFTLDLTLYSGQSVNVAYAFATDVGISQYSAATVIDVPDICIVSELSDSEVDIRFTLDERAGFFTHYLLNVSWCPSNCPDQVSHYVVTSTPVNNPRKYCGETLTETVNSFSSSVLLQSSNPRPLELHCNYEVEVQVVLGDTTQEVSKTVILPNVQERDVPLLDILGCPVTYRRSENKYEVDFQWRVPFSAAALSHINRFVIRGDARQRGLNNPVVQVGVFREDVFVNSDSSDVYFYKTLLTPFEVSRQFYSLSISLTTFEDTDQFYVLSVEVAWKNPPGPARSDNCMTVDTPAPPPFPIANHNITIIARDALDIMQTEDITIIAIVIVRFEWEEPELNYTLAPITQYQAHLALQPLLPDAEGNEIVSYNGNARVGSIIRTFTNLDISKDSFTAYLQIRSFQFDSLPSRWSAAQAINISLQHFECNVRRDSQFAVIIDCVPNPISARTQCSFAGGPFHPCTLPLVITDKVSPQGVRSLSVISSFGAEPFTLSYDVMRTRSPPTSPNVPPLGIYLVNDSPLVSSNGNGSVQAEFQLTRPVKSVRCSLRSLFGRVNQHCSSQKVTFSGLQPGFYILRIHAHNSEADKITVRRGVVVTSDPTFCSLVLINRGVILGEDGSSATVEFKAHGPPVQHSCVLDNGEIFDCASPVVLASLNSGRHKLRIIPRGCVGRFKSVYVSFTIL